MLLESDLIPFTLAPPVGNKSIVLSPHPDDETLGCGGTIRLLLKSKKHVKVVFLTSGDKADPSNNLQHIVPSPLAGEGKGEGGFSNESHITEYALIREKEAVKALSVLGVSDYEFFRFPDRELSAYYEDVLERLLKIVESYMPDTIYSPSMIELNPDHRTTEALSMELQKTIMRTNTSTLIPKLSDFNPPPLAPPARGGDLYRYSLPLKGRGDVPPIHPSPSSGEDEGRDDAPPSIPPPQVGRVREGVMPLRLVFYEITTPLRPNILIDITSVYNKKKQAIKKYKSQLKLTDYLRHITSLNTIRSLTLNGPQYVEAFWCVDKPLNEEDIAKWLSYQREFSGHLPY